MPHQSATLVPANSLVVQQSTPLTILDKSAKTNREAPLVAETAGWPQ